jgi:lipoyl(octanoyl) transferase
MITWISLPGLTPYNQALELMEQKLHDVINGHNETIFLLEHPDIYTAGTNYNKNELRSNNNNIPVIYTGRGGKFTYHGPGQRVIYPILNLSKPNRIADIKLYVRNLEQWIINCLKQFGLVAYAIKGMVGIWVLHNDKHAKIAAIGVRVKKWVTYHGIAVNVTTNLENYSGIIPCGIDDFPLTSLKELGVDISTHDFDFILQKEFKKIFR